MQDNFINQKIEELMFEVSKSQYLDSMQQVLIEDMLSRCAAVASSSSMSQSS